MKTISVVIPAYNCARSIRRTVASILSSGITDYEILIIDDGSVDGTADICDILAKENAYIRCVHQENAGVSSARNRGVIEASGEYLWFIDADDSIKENSFPRLLAILKDCAPDMLVFGLEFDYFHKGQIYRKDELLPPMDGLVNAAVCGGRLYDLFLANSLSSLCNRLVKRSILLQMEELLKKEMILYEDLEFTLRVMKHCRSIYFYQDAIYQYRQSEDGGNAGRRLTRIRHIPDLIAKISEPLAGEADKDKILLALYLTLAREKNMISTKKGIETVCRDFRSWIDEQKLFSKIEQRDYPMLLYQGRITKLMAKQTFSKLRHSAANSLKRIIGDFRKW